MYWFFKPTAESLRRKQLREAEVELATAEYGAEYYNGYVSILRRRVQRLSETQCTCVDIIERDSVDRRQYADVLYKRPNT